MTVRSRDLSPAPTLPLEVDISDASLGDVVTGIDIGVDDRGRERISLTFTRPASLPDGHGSQGQPATVR